MRDSYTSERCDVLQRSCFGSSGGNNDGVLHGVVLLESLDELSDGRTLLADSNVDTVKLLGLVVAVVPPLLVEDGVERNSGLAGLTITNDQLTLATANGNHGVDGLETGLYRLVDGVAGKNAGSLELSTAPLRGVDGTLAVDGVAESVDDTAEHLTADRHVDLKVALAAIDTPGVWDLSTHNLTGTLDGLALLDETIGTKQHDTHLSSFEVHHHLKAQG